MVRRIIQTHADGPCEGQEYIYNIIYLRIPDSCLRDNAHGLVFGACRGRPTDIYALGACLYTFVFGRIPFNAPNVFKLFQVVQHEPLKFPEDVHVSYELRDLLLRMLAKVGPAEQMLMRA